MAGKLVDGRHVHHGTGTVIDAGEANETDVVGDHLSQRLGLNAFDRVCVNKAKYALLALRDPLQHVPHGRKIIGISDYYGPVGSDVDGRHRQFVEVDGRGVADDHLARSGAHQMPDPVADSGG